MDEDQIFELAYDAYYDDPLTIDAADNAMRHYGHMLSLDDPQINMRDFWLIVRYIEAIRLYDTTWN